MSTYCVTSRIADKTVQGQSYADRRARLIENIRGQGGFWQETTSFYLVESNLMTPAFAAVASRGLSEQDDLIVVFDPSDMSAAYFGPLAEENVLRSFFRSLQMAR